MSLETYIAVLIAAASIVFSACIIIFCIRKLKIAKSALNYNDMLRFAFMDADERLVYLKDENLKYVFVNKSMERLYHLRSAQFEGKDDFELFDRGFAEKIRKSDNEIIESGCMTESEVEWLGQIYRTIKFPITLLSGQLGIGAFVDNITQEREHEKKQEKVLNRHRILAEVLSLPFSSRADQLDYALHEALQMTESQYGYIYLYDEQKREFTLNSWTRGVMHSCGIADKNLNYMLDDTGIWGEVVRQRKPIVVNDFHLPNPLRKGYPEGHVRLKTFMSIPVIIDDMIVAVIGLANKMGDYDENDVYEITMLMNGIWNAAERREALVKLSLERNKYLQTLISIGDGVMVVDKSGRIEIFNHIAEKLTGFSASDALGRHYADVFLLTHETDGVEIEDPIERVFRTDRIYEMEDTAMLISRDGKKYYLEDSAAPIKDEQGKTVGVVMVSRDVTSKKEQHNKIEYLSFHDPLTGLYNRRFFDEELQRLDNERNLPISIIMGDINGLKITNDTFGHAVGDDLIKKTADILRKACRDEDIIARTGGDEFIILLPRTDADTAQKIILRIARSLSGERIAAIKCSMAMGCSTKSAVNVDMERILISAENAMYKEKALNSRSTNSDIINAIIASLYTKSPREQQHSIEVADLCLFYGEYINLPDTELKKIRTAGFLHDIGKIIFSPNQLNDSPSNIDSDRSELKSHPLIGYRILNSFDNTMELADIVLAHHERWDGTGYPKGLKEEDIPPLSRIISVAECYERVMNGGAGFEPAGMEKALNLIEERSGKYFDPKVVDNFLEMIELNLIYQQ